MRKLPNPYIAIARSANADLTLYAPRADYPIFEILLRWFRDPEDAEPYVREIPYREDVITNKAESIIQFKKDIKVFNDKYNLCLEFINICDNCGSDEYSTEYYEDGMCDVCAMRCRGCERVIELVDLPDPDSDLCDECDDLHSVGL